MRTYVQQIMLGTVTGSEEKARQVLARMKAAGYEGLELNRFMIHPTSLFVRMLTKAAGMPTGKGGKLDWPGLLKEEGLDCVSLQTDLGSLEREPDQVITDAKSLGTDRLVITGMYRFDYSSEAEVRKLAERLNIPFYDKQIDRLAAQQYGIPLAQMEKITQRLEREPQRIYADAAYAMTNTLSPEEEIFVAQSKVIRQIAASGESCVILGRCADWLLYDDPNCFRIFVHARPDVRVKRTMAVFGLSEEEARRQVEATDRARAQYYERYTGREYGKQKYYHLGLDSGLLGTDESVESIINILRRWCDVRGTHPLYML